VAYHLAYYAFIASFRHNSLRENIISKNTSLSKKNLEIKKGSRKFFALVAQDTQRLAKNSVQSPYPVMKPSQCLMGVWMG
jgi:hypothetical protein